MKNPMVFIVILGLIIIGTAGNLAAGESREVDPEEAIKKQLQKETAEVEKRCKKFDKKCDRNAIKLAVVFCRVAERLNKENNHIKAIEYYKMALILCPLHQRAQEGLFVAREAVKEQNALASVTTADTRSTN